ncbi:hypothetical protein B566_EDAN002893 [Ephemera danica]|nr:hypothetical protein B566_EDAN002893 [Ephemera danica]
MVFYAQGSHQRSFGKDFHHPVSQSSASSILTEISDLLIVGCLETWIKFPTTLEEQQRTKMGFFINFNMSGIIFAIDGTKVAIYPPPVEHPMYPERLYVDRTGKTSLNVQITCDHEQRITSMNSQYPGSVHDSFIYRNSEPHNFMQAAYRNGLRNTYGLGDSGYPMLQWLLTPYPQEVLLAHQQHFNIAHKSCRSVVERTIGAWKNTMRCMGRFRVLHYSPPKAGRLCLATAILYNIGKSRNVIPDEPIVIEDEDDDNPDQGADERAAGRLAREQYALQFYG